MKMYTRNEGVLRPTRPTRALRVTRPTPLALDQRALRCAVIDGHFAKLPETVIEKDENCRHGRRGKESATWKVASKFNK